MTGIDLIIELLNTIKKMFNKSPTNESLTDPIENEYLLAKVNEDFWLFDCS